MPRLSPISWQKLVKRMHELGFEGPLEGGKHPYMVRGDLVVTIPNPHRSEIGADLLQKILRRAGISREEWQE